jgi:hypothetical protein
MDRCMDGEIFRKCKRKNIFERKNIYFPTTAHNFLQLLTMICHRKDYRQDWVERDCRDRIKILNFTKIVGQTDRRTDREINCC